MKLAEETFNHVYYSVPYRDGQQIKVKNFKSHTRAKQFARKHFSVVEEERTSMNGIQTLIRKGELEPWPLELSERK